MKFLHIADLHLGKTLYGVSLIDNQDQPYWVEQFLKKAQELLPDAVLIAGDIYDRGAPSGEAVALLNRMLTGLEEMGIPILMAAGNHDSGKRLSFAGDILAKQGVYIAGMAEREIAHVTIPERDGSGEVTFWLLPYLFPAIVAQTLSDDSIGDYESAMRKLLARQKIDFSGRNVLLAHQNVTAGGREAPRGGSESMVGGVGQMDYRVFDGFDYVALGHIHASYSVGRREVRYAGSPLCYHFDEIRQPAKGLLLVELGEKGKVDVSLLEPPPKRDLRTIRGTLESLLADNEPSEDYIMATLTDEGAILDAMPRLREKFPHILGIRFAAREQDISPESASQAFQRVEQLGRLTPFQLFERFYEQVRGEPLSEQRRELVQGAVRAALEQEEELEK